MGRTWGRLYAGTRNHRKIKILRQRHPTMWFAWYVLIELAIECDDDGWIYVAPDRPYTWKELAQEIGTGRSDNAERFVRTLIDLGLASHTEGKGIRLTSYSERNYESDSSTARVQKYRERKKSEGVGETFQERSGNVSVTDQNRNRTETEQKQNKTEVRSAPLPTPEGSAEGSAPPDNAKIPVFKCPHFEVTQEYFDSLASDYPALTSPMLLDELKKAADYASDNKGRFKRLANGQLKNPRLFLRNWLSKVIVPQQMPRSPTSSARTSRTERNIATAMAWAEKKEREMQTQEESWTPETSRDSPQ